MKIFGFVKKLFFLGLTILSDFTNVNSLNCIAMNNKEYHLEKMFVIINNIRIKINVDVNIKN